VEEKVVGKSTFIQNIKIVGLTPFLKKLLDYTPLAKSYKYCPNGKKKKSPDFH